MNLVQLLIGGALFVLHVDTNTSIKRRINTLEHRMNSLEIRVNSDSVSTNEMFDHLHQRLGSLNVSVNEDQKRECPVETSEERNELDSYYAGLKTGEDVASKEFLKVLLSSGIADEKKWIRGKLKELEKQSENKLSILSNKLDRQIEEMRTEVEVQISQLREELTFHKLNIETIIKETDIRTGTMFRELEHNLSSILKAVLESTNHLKQSLESNITEGRQVINELKLEIDSLKQRLDNVTEQSVNVSNPDQKALESCPNGWTQFQSFCYLYVSEAKVYSSAKDYCQSLGANVADIESSFENDFIYNLCKDSGHSWGRKVLWIGLSDEAEEGVWISDRTGTATSYTNWRRGQPDGGTEQNVVIMGYKKPYTLWNDWDGGNDWIMSSAYSFVCKISTAVTVN